MLAKAAVMSPMGASRGRVLRLRNPLAEEAHEFLILGRNLRENAATEGGLLAVSHNGPKQFYQHHRVAAQDVGGKWSLDHTGGGFLGSNMFCCYCGRVGRAVLIRWGCKKGKDRGM